MQGSIKILPHEEMNIAGNLERQLSAPILIVAYDA